MKEFKKRVKLDYLESSSRLTDHFNFQRIYILVFMYVGVSLMRYKMHKQWPCLERNFELKIFKKLHDSKKLKVNRRSRP